MRLKHPSLILAALLVLLISSSRASAALVAYIANDPLATGGGDTIVTDQGVGDNFPGSAFVGQVSAGALNVAGFSIVTNVAQSKPLVGSAAAPQLTLTFQATSTDDLTHTVYLYVTDTGFTGVGGYQLSLSGSQFPASGPLAQTDDSIQGGAWGRNSNINLDLSNSLAQVGPTGDDQFNLFANGSVAPSANPYSLAIGVAITRTSAGTTGGTLQLTVPEPATATLAASLVALTTLRRRRACA